MQGYASFDQVKLHFVQGLMLQMTFPGLQEMFQFLKIRIWPKSQDPQVSGGLQQKQIYRGKLKINRIRLKIITGFP